jgi:hypothetical protein
MNGQHGRPQGTRRDACDKRRRRAGIVCCKRNPARRASNKCHPPQPAPPHNNNDSDGSDNDIDDDDDDDDDDNDYTLLAIWPDDHELSERAGAPAHLARHSSPSRLLPPAAWP